MRKYLPVFKNASDVELFGVEAANSRPRKQFINGIKITVVPVRPRKPMIKIIKSVFGDIKMVLKCFIDINQLG